MTMDNLLIGPSASKGRALAISSVARRFLGRAASHRLPSEGAGPRSPLSNGVLGRARKLRTYSHAST